MQIFHADISYSEVLAEIHKLCFPKSWSQKNIAELLHNRFNKAIIVTDEDNNNLPVGFAIYTKIDKEAELLTICTIPEYRRKGVAKHIIKSIKANKIFLDVDEDNLPAITLYNKLGFSIDKIRDKYYENGHNAIIMSKEIL